MQNNVELVIPSVDLMGTHIHIAILRQEPEVQTVECLRNQEGKDAQREHKFISVAEQKETFVGVASYTSILFLQSLSEFVLLKFFFPLEVSDA